MFKQRFLEGADIVQAFKPVDLQAAANTGDWINLANVERVIVHFVSAIGTAGDDPIITLKQATSAAGGSAKNLSFSKVYYKVGATALSAIGEWTELEKSDSNAYEFDTDPINGAENELQVAIEVTPAMLDGANGFTWLQVSVADVGSNAQLGYAEYIAVGRKYARDPGASLIA